MYRKKGLPLPGVDDAMDEEAALRAYCTVPHAQRRGRYDLTVAALERAFSPGDLHFGFYETMFEPASIAAFARFAGLEFRGEAATARFNESPKQLTLSAETRAFVASAHAETLTFCRDRFPQAVSLWRSYSDT